MHERIQFIQDVLVRIREVLRLKAEGLSDRQIAAAIGSARSTVQECIRRCRDDGLVWPLAPELDEETLHARLYPASSRLVGGTVR